MVQNIQRVFSIQSQNGSLKYPLTSKLNKGLTAEIDCNICKIGLFAKAAMLAGHWLWLFSRWCTGLCSVRDGHGVHHIPVVLVSMTLALCPRPVIGECGASETIHAWALSGAAEQIQHHAMPCHAVNVSSVPNGFFQQAAGCSSLVHDSFRDRRFSWGKIFGCILHRGWLLAPIYILLIVPIPCNFCVAGAERSKWIRGWAEGLRGWGAEGVRSWHVTRFHKGLNAKSEELGTCQVTGLQYAFAGSFFSDVNEAVQRCAWHDWITERQRTWIAFEWYWMKKWMKIIWY